MRVVLQRVRSAQVTIADQVVGAIDTGVLVLLGVRTSDSSAQAEWLAEKLVHLRIFADADGKMNRSVLEAGGSVLVVSQFTLYGECAKGRRPSFIDAARPELAVPLYEQFVAALRSFGVLVQTGQFGADMQVSLVNDGPVTLVLDRD